MSGQITTITFFQVSGFQDRFWALQQMQFGHRSLSDIPGLDFYKLMGSGRGSGFDWRPEWGRYALVAVWNNEAAADRFFLENAFYQTYASRSTDVYTIFMQCIAAHGEWDGRDPFISQKMEYTGPVAVITRATIRTRHLWNFWRFVAPVASSLSGYKEKILSVGIGEWPLIMQATFSIWTDEKAMLHYAYQNPEHRAVVEKTRKLGWYSEELFARFIPYRTEGRWYGDVPLSLVNSIY